MIHRVVYMFEYHTTIVVEYNIDFLKLISVVLQIHRRWCKIFSWSADSSNRCKQDLHTQAFCTVNKIAKMDAGQAVWRDFLSVYG